MESSLFALSGAVAVSEGVDRSVPAHYGNPLREQARLSEGEAFTHLAREVVVVSGPERLSWLTTLGSQVLENLKPGDGGAETLILDANGHIRWALAALDDGEQIYLVTDPGTGEELRDFLDSMRFMLRVEVRMGEELGVLGAMGAGLKTLADVAEQSALIWRDPWPGVVEGGTSYDVGLYGFGGPDTPYRHPGRNYSAGFVLVPAEKLRAVALAVGDAGLLPAGAHAWEALRIEAGRPRAATEVDGRAIPNELDWLRTAVHLTKGCYPGQETIARTLNLGRPPRRLTLLQLDGLSGDMPRPGDAVRLGERAVGSVTSVARHHEWGPIALAMLRRNVPLGELLLVDVTEEPDPEELCAREAADEGATSEGRPGAQASEGFAGGDHSASGEVATPTLAALAGAARSASDLPEATVLTRVAARQEALVSPEGKAQASPEQRPGAGLRDSLLGRR